MMTLCIGNTEEDDGSQQLPIDQLLSLQTEPTLFLCFEIYRLIAACS